MEKEKKFIKLRELILTKYQTMAEFADDMNFSSATLSAKLNGKTPWRVDHIKKCCELLKIPDNDINLYFLT